MQEKTKKLSNTSSLKGGIIGVQDVHFERHTA